MTIFEEGLRAFQAAPVWARASIGILMGAVAIFWVRSSYLSRTEAQLRAQRELHQEHLRFKDEVIGQLRIELEGCNELVEIKGRDWGTWVDPLRGESGGDGPR